MLFYPPNQDSPPKSSWVFSPFKRPIFLDKEGSCLQYLCSRSFSLLWYRKLLHRAERDEIWILLSESLSLIVELRQRQMQAVAPTNDQLVVSEGTMVGGEVWMLILTKKRGRIIVGLHPSFTYNREYKQEDYPHSLEAQHRSPSFLTLEPHCHPS